MMMLRAILSCLFLVSAVSSFGIAPQNTVHHRVSSSAPTKEDGSLSRTAFLQSLLLSTLAVVPPARAAEAITLPNGVVYTVVKQGSGPKPDRGELVALRFAAFAGDTQIDNIFDTPEPYYTRLGSGALLPGVEETLPLMQLGDRWRLTIPGDLAFGKKGRPASAGKPRIPADAVITFDVEMVGLPGKEPELIDIIGDV